MKFNVGDKVINKYRPDLGIGTIELVAHRIHVRWQRSHGFYPPGTRSLAPHSEPKSEPAKSEELPVLLNGQQKNVLLSLYRVRLMHVTGTKVRTDAIAKQAAQSASVMAKVGLELRALGLVESHNDGQQYNYWTLTLKGQVLAVAESNRTVTPATAKPAEKWIVWCPGGDNPPRVVHTSEADALAVAESMANSYPGKTFHACKVNAGFCLKQTKKIVQKEVLETKMEMV